VIIDTSALIAALVSEEASDAAQHAIAGAGTLAAPDLLIAELANGLWAKVQRGLVPQQLVAELLHVGLRRVDRLVPCAELADPALVLAVANEHPAYDCFFVALAERERQPLLTCDTRLAQVFGAIIDVRLLGASPAPPAGRAPGRRR
jgi:predicted nucleic acid-binding protein